MIKDKAQHLQKIVEMLNPAQKRRSVYLLFLTIFGVGMETLGVGIIIPTVSLIGPESGMNSFPWLASFVGFFGATSKYQMIVFVMIAFMSIYFCKIIYLGLLARWEMKFLFDLQEEFSFRLFKRYIYQPYSFHLQRNSAELIRKITGEVNIVVFDNIAPVIKLFSEGFVVLGLSVLLLLVEPIGATVALAFLGGASWIFQKKTKRYLLTWGRDRIYHDSLSVLHLQQGLGGIKDAKLLGREKGFLDKFRIHNSQRTRIGSNQSTLQLLPRLWIELLAVTGLSSLVLTMVYQGRKTEAIIPILGLFAAAAFRLMPSVGKILISLQSLRFGVSAVNSISSEFSLGIDYRNNASSRIEFNKQIELKHISFKYESAIKPAIEDVTLSIRKGEAVGFIGQSGSGKSTLVDIILGLLVPQHGEVTIDGKNIHHDLRSWQSLIGYVPQAIFLADDNLKRNIAFGVPDSEIDENMIWEALRLAQLDDFVKALPEGIETAIGERGVRLSGGQRQRIGIARSLYHKPEILVFDEATSALDVTTEVEVMESVYGLARKKTVLIVAHRLSTLEKCDRVYSFKQGRLIQHGTPQEVLWGVKSH